MRVFNDSILGYKYKTLMSPDHDKPLAHLKRAARNDLNRGRNYFLLLSRQPRMTTFIVFPHQLTLDASWPFGLNCVSH